MTASSRRRDHVRAIDLLRRRPFGLFFTGNLISNSGTWFHSVAQVLLVYRLTGSAVLVGLVNSAQFAGTFLVAPWAGGTADRYDRRRLVMLMAAVSAALSGCLAGLVAAGVANTPIVIAIAVAIGLAWAFTAPALQAMIPNLVEPAAIPEATALHSLSFNLARAIGPTLSAVIIARFDLAVAFAVNAASFTLLVASFSLVDPRPRSPRPIGRPLLRETIAIVRRDLRLVTPLAALAAMSIAIDPITTLGPKYATNVFGRPDTLTGHLISAEALGAVTAAILMARHPRPSYATIASALVLLGLAMCSFAASSTLPLSLVALYFAGFALVRTITSSTTLLQMNTSDEHRGRLLALWSIAFLGFRAVGAVVDGATASVLGIRIGTVAMSLPALAVASWIVATGLAFKPLAALPARPHPGPADGKDD